MKQLALAAIGAIALTAAAPRRERAVPFAVGEALTYDVSWSSYLVAGSATATVTDKTSNGSDHVYTVVAEGQPTPLIASLYTLHYRIESRIDAFTLLPTRSDLSSREGRRTRTHTTTFDRAREPLAEDALSAIYTLRATPLKPRDRLTLPIVDNGVTYSARIEVREAEPVRCGLGTISAFPVAITAVTASGETAGRNLALWISTDARKLPVKLEGDLPVGRFVLLLRSAANAPR